MSKSDMIEVDRVLLEKAKIIADDFIVSLESMGADPLIELAAVTAILARSATRLDAAGGHEIGPVAVISEIAEGAMHTVADRRNWKRPT